MSAPRADFSGVSRAAVDPVQSATANLVLPSRARTRAELLRNLAAMTGIGT